MHTAKEQRGELEFEEVESGEGYFLSLLVSILVEGVVERTVGRKIAALEHGVVLAAGIVDDGHLVVEELMGTPRFCGREQMRLPMMVLKMS